MKRLRFSQVLTLLAMLVLPAAVPAETLGVKWAQRLDVPGVGDQDVAAARILADGHLMVIAEDNQRLTSLVYDVDGSLVSSHVLGDIVSGHRYPRVAAIGAFGEVYVTTFESELRPEDTLLIAKFDGFSGSGLWERRIASPGTFGWNPEPLLAIGPDGNVYYVAWGPESRAFIGKLDQNGETLWGPSIAAQGQPIAAVSDPSGDVTVLTTRWLASGGESWVVRISGATGVPMWGPRQPAPGLSTGLGGSLALDHAGDVVATLRGVDGGVDSIVTGKFEGASGERIWGPSYYRGEGSARPSSLVVTPAGDVLIGGSTGQDAALLKLDSRSGAILWTERYPARGGHLQSIAADGSGSAYVAVSEGTLEPDILLRRVDVTSGRTLWGPVTFGEPGLAERSNAIVLDHQNGIVLLGTGANEPMSPEGGLADGDVILQRFEGTGGQALWPEPLRFRGLSTYWDEHSVEVLEHPSGDLIFTIVKWFEGYWRHAQRWIVARVSPEGKLKWGGDRRPGGVPFVNRMARSVVDSAGDVTTVGNLSGEYPTGPVAAVKHSGSDGQLIWGPVPLGVWHIATATGVAVAGLPNGDTVTVVPGEAAKVLYRIGATAGQIEWGPIEVATGDDYIEDLKYSDGGVFLVRKSGTGHWLSRRDASSGALTWSSMLPYAFGFRIWMDTAGNPVLSHSGGGPAGILKYSGSNGTLVWSRQLGHPRNVFFDESGEILTVDSSLVVTRMTADGATLWQRDHSEGSTVRYWAAARMDGTIAVAGIVDVTSALNGRELIVTLVDPATGDLLSRQQYDFYVHASPAGLFPKNNDLIVVDDSLHLIRLTPDLVIDARSTREPLAARLAVPFEHQFFGSGGQAPYTWSAVSSVSVRTLPAGLSIDSATGRLSGTPLEEGEFRFNLRTRDGQGAVVEAPVILRVFPTRTFRLPAQRLTTCAGRSLTLTAGDHETYRWYPWGERTSSIEVRPSWRLPYGVHVTEADGSSARGAVEVEVLPSCHSITSIEPVSGPAAGGFPIVIRGSAFDGGATVRIGGIDSPIVAQRTDAIETIAPSLAPGTLHDVAVTIGGRTAVLPRAFFAQFTDVASTHPFAPFIEAAFRKGMTGGCESGRFCLDDPVLRSHAAVFLLKAKYGATYQPPAPPSQRFIDVPPGSFAAAHIEKLASDGIAAGCGGGKFCPSAPVSRAQAAVVILKTRHGASFTPPPAEGMFFDVPPSDPFAPWIEELARTGVSSGCGGGNFCPNAPVSRGQMMVLLARAFGWI